MTASAWFQTAFFFGIVLLAVRPLGGYMARVYTGERTLLSVIFGPLERMCYRVIAVAPDREDGWATYARQLVLFTAASVLAVYAMQRMQSFLPVNPLGLGAVEPTLALITVVRSTSCCPCRSSSPSRSRRRASYRRSTRRRRHGCSSR